MGTINLSSRAGFGIESLKAMTGAPVAFDAFAHCPVIVIFDNQSTSAVAISTDSAGLNIWRTFPAGEALVLDLRAAHGMASNYTFDQGTVLYGNGAATGNFSISYIYARAL